MDIDGTYWYQSFNIMVPCGTSVKRGSMAKRAERHKRSETADDRRKRIQEAAFGVVKKRGYAQATTLEIATRAKVSKRELYALFDDKQSIIASCIAERVRQMQMPLELPAVRDRDGLAQLLFAFGSTVLRVVSDSAVTTLFRVAVAEAEGTPEIAAALDSIGRAQPARRRPCGTLPPGGPPSGGQPRADGRTLLRIAVGGSAARPASRRRATAAKHRDRTSGTRCGADIPVGLLGFGLGARRRGTACLSWSPAPIP